ncbi:FUSC family protein [Streptomyces sp. RPT161]|uniref:FUSC family protein n=1 Tax=Streptomyces sp. RPT161 TaxID=3015993 RepID=UPI0022B92704|nr:FUSC family protein [Streptomyces sp. RPT161]
MDRVIASDPGLIRFLSAARIVTAILLCAALLAASHYPPRTVVTGATAAEVFSFAVSATNRREQAVTLAVGLPTGLAALTVGTLIAPNRPLADLMCVVVVFLAAYSRRFGKRGSDLGVIAFQMYFISLFVRTGPEVVAQESTVLVIGWCSAVVVRFAVVRVSPQRTLLRLCESFRARLLQLIDSLIEVAEQGPDAPTAEPAMRRLRRRTARLHQAALMIQDHLDEGIRDPAVAADVQRRIADAEVAAERLGAMLLGALGRPGANPVAHDLTDRLVAGRPPEQVPLEVARPDLVRRLVADLRALREIASRTAVNDQGVGLKIVRDRLLGYRDPERLPEAPAPVRDVFRAIGELSRGLMGLRIALAGPDDSPDDSPEAARSREELQTEEAVLEAEDTAQRAASRQTEPTGMRRASTRVAVQVAVASALAILGGELLSPQRWSWAVLTCWVVFVNTSSSGEILVKGYRRITGTLIGVLAGIWLADLVGNEPWTAFALLMLCVFGSFYTTATTYALSSFFVTAMLCLLYTLLHSLTPGLLELRLGESAIGAACAILAGTLVLPVHTYERTEQQVREVLGRLREVTGQGVAELSGGRPVDLLERARTLDNALDELRTATQPLRHPITPLRNRRRITRYVLGLLETAAYHARSLAAMAQLATGRRTMRSDVRLREAAQRVDRNLDALITCLESGGNCREPLDTGAKPLFGRWRRTSSAVREPRPEARQTEEPDTTAAQALRHLRRVDEEVVGLARPLGMRLDTDQREPSDRHDDAEVIAA